MTTPSETILATMIPWLEADWPLDWAECFGRATGPTVCEIGFGNGSFLVAQARRRPQARCIGIEMSWGPTQGLLKRVARHRIDNVRILKGDAAAIIERVVPPRSLDEVHINFPDPWYKARHEKRRLIQPRFLETLSDRMTRGGRLVIATDHEGLADWVENTLRAQSDFSTRHAALRVFELPGRPATKYEIKARDEGRRINFFDMTCVSRRAAASVQLQEVTELPNVLFKGDADLGTVLREIAPSSDRVVVDGEEIVCAFVRVWRDPGGDAWLVETHVHDGRLAQQVGLVVSHRDAGRITVRLAPLGTPRTTTGLKRAVWLLAREILARHPGLSVARSTVGDLDSTAGEDS